MTIEEKMNAEKNDENQVPKKMESQTWLGYFVDQIKENSLYVEEVKSTFGLDYDGLSYSEGYVFNNCRVTDQLHFKPLPVWCISTLNYKMVTDDKTATYKSPEDNVRLLRAFRKNALSLSLKKASESLEFEFESTVSKENIRFYFPFDGKKGEYRWHQLIKDVPCGSGKRWLYTGKKGNNQADEKEICGLVKTIAQMRLETAESEEELGDKVKTALNPRDQQYKYSEYDQQMMRLYTRNLENLKFFKGKHKCLSNINIESIPYVLVHSEDLEGRAGRVCGDMYFVARDIAPKEWQQQIVAWHELVCGLSGHEHAKAREIDLAKSLGKEKEYKKWRAEIDQHF